MYDIKSDMKLVSLGILRVSRAFLASTDPIIKSRACDRFISKFKDRFVLLLIIYFPVYIQYLINDVIYFLYRKFRTIPNPKSSSAITELFLKN